MSRSLRRDTGTGWPQQEDVAYDRTLYARSGAAVALADDPAVDDYWRRLISDGDWPFTPDRRAELRWLIGADVMLPGIDSRIIWSLVHRLEQEREVRQARERTCLYRFLDDSDRLLYVGISQDPDVRERQHRASQRWAPLIDEREDEWFDTRREALTAELDAIRDESPLFNEAGRPRLPALEPEESA